MFIHPSFKSEKIIIFFSSKKLFHFNQFFLLLCHTTTLLIFFYHFLDFFYCYFLVSQKFCCDVCVRGTVTRISVLYHFASIRFVLQHVLSGEDMQKVRCVYFFGETITDFDKTVFSCAANGRHVGTLPSTSADVRSALLEVVFGDECDDNPENERKRNLLWQQEVGYLAGN